LILKQKVMQIILKIVLTIVVFLFGGLLVTIMGQITGHSKGGGPLGIVIMIGIIAAIRAVWKYKSISSEGSNLVSKVEDETLNKN